MNLILSCLFYAPFMPAAIPIAGFGILFNYWVTKYLLINFHKMPDDLGPELINFFCDMLPKYGSSAFVAGYFLFAYTTTKQWLINMD